MLNRLLLVLTLIPVGCKDKGTGSPTPPSKEMTPVVRLHLAAREGDIELVQSLIAGGCDVDARDEDGHTPLYTATDHGQAKVVEVLISKGADVNAEAPNGATVLGAAIHWGAHLDIAELLIAAGADVQGHLYNAAWQDQKEVAELLLANGAQINPSYTRSNERLLFFAIRHGFRDLVERLLVAGTDADAIDYMTALTAAVHHGDKEVVALLIAHGADVNKADLSYARPLSCVWYRTKDVAELLLAHGADVNAGMVLHGAVARGDRVIVELFLAHGADVNRKDYRGETPLDEAIARGNEEIVEILRRHGGVSGHQ